MNVTTSSGALVLLACLPMAALTLTWAMRRRRLGPVHARLPTMAMTGSASLLAIGIAVLAGASGAAWMP